MSFEFKDKKFPIQTKLTAKEMETYCSIYNKEYHEIKFYSDDLYFTNVFLITFLPKDGMLKMNYYTHILMM